MTAREQHLPLRWGVLSPNARDKPRVRWLAERLRPEGLGMWFDDWEIR